MEFTSNNSNTELASARLIRNDLLTSQIDKATLKDFETVFLEIIEESEDPDTKTEMMSCIQSTRLALSESLL